MRLAVPVAMRRHLGDPRAVDQDVHPGADLGPAAVEHPGGVDRHRRDKQSNWFDMEKGFLLMKRPVPAGVTPKQWCITVRG